MKPTIEEVKLRYSKAKEVKSVDYVGQKIIDISDYNVYDFSIDGCVWIDLKGKASCCLWDDNYGFAEIISYKTPKLEIDKDLILKIADKCPSCKDDLKKEFPSVFENKLEVGKWYKTPKYKTLICITKVVDEENVLAYGFGCNSGNWLNENDVCEAGLKTWNAKDLEPAQHSEILSALKKEAEKRGLVEGATIKNHQGTFKLRKLDIVYSEKYNNGIWTRQGENGIWLFINGTWATPIQTVTQKELLDFYKSEKGITNEIIVEG